MKSPLRGVETSLGQAGFCDHCQTWNPEGPDVCLGHLPGVMYACCGHGDSRRAYVVIGTERNGDGIPLNAEILQRELALRYFGDLVPVEAVTRP